MLSKLLDVDSLRPLLPFVRSVYARPSRYVWQGDTGQLYEVQQKEGGERGDPQFLLCSASQFTTHWRR